MSLDVGVVGCGTAGAAVALFLARAGHEVTVYERVPEPGPVGAGILLQPTGQAVLARLGLLDEVRAQGSPIDRLWCRRRNGKTLVDLHYAEIGDGVGLGLGIHRGVLFQALFRALRAEPRAALRLGTSIESLDGLGHDLVVLADGAESAAQRVPALGARSRGYPWGALWFVARDPARAIRSHLHQVVDGAHTLLGLLPTGLAPGTGEPVVSLFWSIRCDAVDAWRAGDLDAWKRRVLELEPLAAPVLDQIRAPGDLLFARYADVRLRRWHGERVVVLGDAAHATSPQLGQGANLALWDAMVLADHLATPGRGIGAALAAYSAARRAHIRYYQLAARWLTPFFQSDSRVGGWLRDRAMPLAMRVGPLRRMMIETMAGVRRGVVRRSMRLSLPAQGSDFREGASPRDA
ncbi:MAG TPA: NAD(P)/FAD-dependent oxidoreductase [Kofleriaceae bacterium]|nr:NAD(P)/FAD-dependent oxidoreductase [Kofleriaceae bacterium]